MLEIVPYEREQEAALNALLKSEGEEWACYWEPPHWEKYRHALAHSVVFVAREAGDLCGYVRAREDDGFGVYVYDLLVRRDKRGKACGRLLMERVRRNFPGQTVYVMSGVDGYYEKLGYRREGSIFEVCAEEACAPPKESGQPNV